MAAYRFFSASASASAWIGRALHLHLFLQARALLSSSIRLNTLGPYLAHQLLLYHMRSILDSVHSQTRNCTTGLVPICTPQAFHEFSNAQATFTLNKTGTGTGTGTERQARTGGKSIDGEVDEEEEPEEEGIGWEWDWEDEGAWDSALGPATTWPVGEIVQGRHDQLHSRLFNS